MRRLHSILIPLLFCSAIAFPASAQVCRVGSYTDAAGTGTHWQPAALQSFPIYVVIHVENAVAGAAYSISAPSQLILSVEFYGPSGDGINVPREGGENVGLGECALGFNDMPVIIAKYNAIPLQGMPGGLVEIGPNLDEDLQWPVYANCSDQLFVCAGIESLTLSPIVANESRSFGNVKALYAQ